FLAFSRRLASRELALAHAASFAKGRDSIGTQDLADELQVPRAAALRVLQVAIQEWYLRGTFRGRDTFVAERATEREEDPWLSERRPSVEGARHAGPREGPERSRPRPEDPRIPRQRPVRDAHGRRGPPQEERPDPTRGAVFGRGNRPIGIVKVELGPVPYLYLEVRPASLGPESVTAHSFLSARSFSWSHSIVCFSRYFWRTRLRASVTRATSRAFPRPYT